MRRSYWAALVVLVAGILAGCGGAGKSSGFRTVEVSPSSSGSDAKTVQKNAKPAGQKLPLSYSPGNATQVVTVVASSAKAKVATVQAWDKINGRWQLHGLANSGYFGSDGIGRASETTNRTPAGSFSLTSAFGRLPNPGTAIPYRQTNPSDWWISQPGPLYNTFQECARNCPFKQGSPNEHLYNEVPYYNYAVVINYNTNPVVQGKGSAFFLHVTVEASTAGCVSVPEIALIRLLTWLKPSAHPRIIIGVAGH